MQQWQNFYNSYKLSWGCWKLIQYHRVQDQMLLTNESSIWLLTYVSYYLFILSFLKSDIFIVSQFSWIFICGFFLDAAFSLTELYASYTSLHYLRFFLPSHYSFCEAGTCLWSFYLITKYAISCFLSVLIFFIVSIYNNLKGVFMRYTKVIIR